MACDFMASMVEVCVAFSASASVPWQLQGKTPETGGILLPTHIVWRASA